MDTLKRGRKMSPALTHFVRARAEIENGHAHRFCDTFAVELLLKGTHMERVSVLLGHRIMRITERHYAPWVRARQEQLEAVLAKTWEQDPVLQAGHYSDYVRTVNYPS